MRHSLGAVALCALILMPACPDDGGDDGSSVSLPASDTTNPTAKMDVFNLPAQATASPGNPVTVDSSCCPASFEATIGRPLDLVGVGEDLDGGIKSVAIWIDLKSYCTDPATSQSSVTSAVGRVEVTQDTATPAPGDDVRTQRVVQAAFRVADHATSCPGTLVLDPSYDARIWVVATNYAGLKEVTQKVALQHP